MNILLFGANGQVGYELLRALSPLGYVMPCYRSAERAADSFVPGITCDLLDTDSIQQVISSSRPDLIVNAAAYTAVDLAESNVEAASQINALAVGAMAESAAILGVPLVHYSTDYVFSGDATRPYVESDPAAPRSVYGQTKWEGEQNVIRSGADHLIFRTAWVYGARGKNFLRTMLRLAGERDQLTVVDDQRGAPVWCRSLAESTALILARVTASHAEGPLQGFENCSGIYHLSARGDISWYGFAQYLLHHASQLGLISEPPEIRPTTTLAYPTPAKRPAYSVLSNDLIESTFGITVQDWRTGVELCLTDMVNSE